MSAISPSPARDFGSTKNSASASRATRSPFTPIRAAACGPATGPTAPTRRSAPSAGRNNAGSVLRRVGTTAFARAVGGDNARDQRMAHDVGFGKARDGDAIDAAKIIERLTQTFGAAGEIAL